MPESVDPRWGGWVSAKQLSFRPLEKGLYQRPVTDAAALAISEPEKFEFKRCKGDWVEIQSAGVQGWSRLFCPQDRGCF